MNSAEKPDSLTQISEPRLKALEDIRHELHALAELSGQEQRTSSLVKEFLEDQAPDDIRTGIGGHGLAAIFRGESSTQTVLLRADLDALPIPETLNLAYGSRNKGVSHKCGHDGHMAILCGVAMWLGERLNRPFDVALVFQPEEETGQGAAKVLENPFFFDNDISYVFAMHNLPGFPLGRVISRHGVFASASQGLLVDLLGRSSHAAEPHRGNSPGEALATLIQGLSSIPQNLTALGEAAKTTVVHARLGELAFGTSPGNARVAATLRTHSESTMRKLEEHCRHYVRAVAKTHKLECDLSFVQGFPVTENCTEAAEMVERAAGALGLSVEEQAMPMPWSEDFGHFTKRYKGAMFGLGAGESCPALHNPDYDFPGALIPIGVSMFASIIEEVWSRSSRV